jgi:hypothetical protein
MTLSARLGGLGIDNPVHITGDVHTASSVICDSLVQQIIKQDPILSINRQGQQQIKNQNKMAKLNKEKAIVDNLKSSMSDTEKRALEASQEKGSSALFTTLPLKHYGFSLSRTQFTDSLLMRYRLPLTGLPSICVCGSSFSLDHSQICHLGGFINKRHDEIRNMIAANMSEVLHDVEVEPHLKPLNSMDILEKRSAITDNEARSDIRARGFWCDQQDAFFDIRVFYPNATSYISRDMRSLYRSFEKAKKNQYGERILQVDQGSFTPLIFSSFGGMSEEANTAVKKLAAMISEKKKDNYSHVVGLLRARLAFALCRAADTCLRGTRKKRAPLFPKFVPADVITFESNI